MSRHTAKEKGKQRADPELQPTNLAGSQDEDQHEDIERYVNRVELPRPPGLENQGRLSFGVLVRLLERWSKQGGTSENKKDELGRFFDRYLINVGKDAFGLLRLLLPQADNRRSHYHLCDLAMAPLLVKILNLTDGNTKARDMNWRVATEEDPIAGDLSQRVFDIMEARTTVLSEIGPYTVDEVDKELEKLAEASQPSSEPSKRGRRCAQADVLRPLFDKMTPLELKWLVRIVTKNLRMGMAERTILNTFHHQGLELFYATSDLKLVSWSLHNPSINLGDSELHAQLGKPWKPMMARRNERNLDNIVEMMHKDRPQEYSKPRDDFHDAENPFWCTPTEFFIEEKMDGARMQLHKIGDTYMYYSRHGTNYTKSLGRDAQHGCLTPALATCFEEMGVIDVILDGELVMYHPLLDKEVSYGGELWLGENERFGLNDWRPYLRVFDVLHLRTEKGVMSLVNLPLYQRKLILSRLFKPQTGVLKAVDVVKASSKEQLSQALNKILEERGEGVVVKHPLSTYRLGVRPPTWCKLKPDYVDEVGESLTLMIVGAYFGKGKRGGAHACFLAALRDDSKPLDDQGYPHFNSLVQLGSGFKLSDFKWIQKETEGRWIDCKPSNLPSWLSTNVHGKDVPDQLIHPKDSFLVEVKAATISETDSHPGRYTLKSARVLYVHKKEREKRLAMACTTSAFIEYCITPKSSTGEDLGRGGAEARSKLVSKPLYVSAPIIDYEVVTDIFHELKFYVANLKHLDKSKPFVDKDSMQKMILEHGGDYGQRIPDNVDSRVVIASEKPGAKTADVLLPDWVLESIQQGRQLPKTKRFYVQATPATETSDEYNSSDSNLADSSNRLESSPVELDGLEGVPPHEGKNKKPDSLLRLSTLSARRRSLFGGSTPEPPEAVRCRDFDMEENDCSSDEQDIFTRVVAYFDTSANAELNGLAPAAASRAEKDSSDKRLMDASNEFVENGGTATVNLLDSKLTHIIVDNAVSARHHELDLKTRNSGHLSLKRVVTIRWIDRSVIEETQVDETQYQPNTRTRMFASL